MAVMLRLARHGQTKRPFYRIVAINKTSRRDGRFIEIIGTLDSMTNPPTAKISEEKVRKWIAVGAKASDSVRDLIAKQIPGLIEGKEKHRLDKIRAARKKRKEKSAKGKSASAPKSAAKKKAK